MTRSLGTQAAPRYGERIHTAASSAYPVIFVDGAGLPIIPLTLWYHVRGKQGPDTTLQTYTACLLPVVRFLAEQGIAWNSRPDRLRAAFLSYFIERLKCQIHPHLAPDGTLDHTRLVATGQSPLAASSIRVLCAALRDFYSVLISAQYYGYANPMTSEARTAFNAAYKAGITNQGAPDIAGIRSEERAHGVRQQSALLSHGSAGSWQPDPLRMRDTVLAGIQRGLDDMASYLPEALRRLSFPLHATWRFQDQRRMAIVLRDRAVLRLLQYTGARVHEIVGMTVGGYRACGQEGWAKLMNKGGAGLEIKVITFASTPAQQALTTYLRYGRPWLDPQQALQLRDVEDTAPIFLTRLGTAYTTKAFEAQWHQLSADLGDNRAISFTPHDIRHWFVTRFLLRAKAECQRKGTSYVDAKALFSQVMAWTNPRTIETYDHSLDQVEGWAEIVAFQHDLQQVSLTPVPSSHELVATGIVNSAAVSLPRTIPTMQETDGGEEGLTGEELAWLDAQEYDTIPGEVQQHDRNS